MGVRLYCVDCLRPVSSELPSHMSLTEGCVICWACFRNRAKRIEGFEKMMLTLNGDIERLKAELAAMETRAIEAEGSICNTPMGLAEE